MTHAEAVAIIKAPRANGPESYLLYSAACSKVYVDHMQQIRPGTFTADVGAPSPDWRVARNNPDAPASSARADMGRDPGSRSGAKLVQVLPGAATSYFITTNGAGEACLFRTVEADDAIDPYRTATGTRVAATADRAAMAREMRARDELRQAEQRVIAKGITAFWREQPTRDEAPQPRPGSIGTQVAAFWDKQRTGAA